LDIVAKEIIFHFNKAHLTNPDILMWIIKTKGETHYIKHLTADCPWSTKETPDNLHTKGSIKFKDCRLTIDENLEAVIRRVI